MRKIVTLVAALAFIPCAVHAEERATTKDAELMVTNAVAFMKKEGKEKALAAYTDPKGPFTYRDLYIFAYDLKGDCVAHGANKAKVGKPFIEDQDADGKFYVKERIQIAKTKGKGWQEYKFLNPVTKKVENKVAFVQLVDGIVIGCGAYRQ